MIQKKYMWGLVLGLLSSGMFVQNINAMFGRRKVSGFQGESQSRRRDQQQEQRENQHEYNLTIAKKLWDDFYGQYLSNDTSNMDTVSSKWLEFFEKNKQDLIQVDVNSPEQLAQRAEAKIDWGIKKDQDYQRDPDVSSSGSGKEEVVGGGSGDSSSSAEASDEEKAAALKALMQLSDHLTLSQSITNQDDWRSFCNAFADLVESGNWKPDQAYEWNGSVLK